MGFLIGGFICLALAILFWYLKSSEEEKMGIMKAIPTSSAREITELAAGVANRMGQKGNFRQLVEVKGVIKCNSPLTSEVAKQQCVYYDMTVTREIEEEHHEKDSHGHTKHTRKKRTETVSSNKQNVPFHVEDQSGRILVNLDKAEIDPVKAVDRFEPADRVRGGGMLSFDGFSLNLGNFSFGNHQPTTLGYRFVESVLPLDRKVYVLGEASDASGELMIQAPKDKGRFIVSLKSEEEMMTAGASSVFWLQIAAAVSGLAGIGLIIARFM